MCNHNNQIGDNYGLSCSDCGKQLKGYGCGGWFGVNLKPGLSCIHQFLDCGDGYEICTYCQLEQKKETPQQEATPRDIT